MPLASLPWYDLTEITDATDAFWRHLASNLRGVGFGDVPRRLCREVPFETQWSSRQFFFGQACGYDVLISHAPRLQLVATPCYVAPGCVGSCYRSFVVVRERSSFQSLTDLRGSRCVINSATSHSGMNILRALVAPLHERGRFFGEVQVSGAHEESLVMLRQKSADVAAIDCVTYALIQRNRPQALAGLRVLCQTHAVPAPPFVTGASTSPAEVEAMRAALWETVKDPQLAHIKRTLLLGDIEVRPLSDYRSIGDLEEHSCATGYCDMDPAWVRQAAAAPR